MKIKDYEKWKDVREKGKSHFILLHGIGRFGLFMALFLTISFRRFAEGWFVSGMFIRAGIGLAIGLFFGLAVWSMNESLFRKRPGVHQDP